MQYNCYNIHVIMIMQSRHVYMIDNMQIALTETFDTNIFTRRV